MKSICAQSAQDNDRHCFIIMNTEKMRSIGMMMNLTIHKISFHIKFPATLSLQMEIDKQTSCIIDGVALGKDIITVNKEVRFETSLNFDDSTKNFEDKKATILICIKTKTSNNKLTAGVIPLQLCNPTQHLKSLIAKPLRCNDPKAFIEYSLRTETVRKSITSPDQTQSTHAGETQDANKNIFKSAVHYNNYWVEDGERQREETGSQNELEKYLSSAIRNDQRKRHKSSGKLPLNSMQNCEDESRTQIMTCRKDQLPNECSIASSRHSFEKQARQLSKRSEVLSKEISEARIIQQNLKNENKELRAKISKYERQLDDQSLQIVNLNKRFEMKENSSSEEVRQLKTKLSDVESQLHQLILEKNQYLNQREEKEKESIAAYKEKEKQLTQEKRKFVTQLQLKRQEIETHINNKGELQESLSHSQKMTTDLIIQLQAKEKECQKLQRDLQALKIDMLDKQCTLQGLQAEAADKGKAAQDLRMQKKLIYQIKQERDQKNIALNQSSNTIKQLQLTIQQKEEMLRVRASSIDNLMKQNESLKNQLKQEAVIQKELGNKLKQYEMELLRSVDSSNKISKQIKTVESELKGIKRQASTSQGEKIKLVNDYEDLIVSLQDKITSLSEQKKQKEQSFANMNGMYKQKEDECYDLGQQLIVSKEQLANLTNQIDLAREENAYLNILVKELSQKQQKLILSEEKLQYNEKLYEELQQRMQLQKIQYENQIKMYEERAEEKTQVLRNLSEQLNKVEQECLELNDQIQTLRIGLANRNSELNYLKMENERNRDTTIQFEQRVAILRRTQETVTSTVEQLREQNDGLRRVVQENSQAITSLGKKYESLYRSTLQTITQFLDHIRSGRKIINLNLRHEKPQITTLINDSIRQIATERDANSIQIARLKKDLEEETAANKQNLKIIRLKAQLQKELEDEMAIMKALEESLQSTIIKLKNDIQSNLLNIKQKEGVIVDLNSQMIALRKEHINQLAKKDETIQKGQQAIDKLNHQIQLDAQRYNAGIDKIKLAMANLQVDYTSKINGLNQTLGEIGAELKSEKDTAKQQRLKINELEANITKITKQKQQVASDLEKRTNQLISTRVQSENKSKTIAVKEEEAKALQKSIDKLSNEKESLQTKLQKSQEVNKETMIKKTESEATIKQRNNEILLLKMRIEEAEDAKNKLIQQRQDLLKNKNTQQTLISTLNQSIKSLKDAALKSEELIKKMTFEKQCSERQTSKKMNILANQKVTLERQFNEFKMRASQKQNGLAAKQRQLADQLRASKVKVGEHSSTITELRKQLEAGNAKMSNLTNEFNAKIAQFQSKEKSLLPNAGKLKEVMQSIAELRAIGKEYETSKSKLLRLTNSANLKEQDYERMCEVAREMGIAINKVKIQILNKLGLSTDVKTTLLEALKGVQLVAEKLNRN